MRSSQRSQGGSSVQLVAAGWIDRATADDMVSLATDVGASPMQVGAVLLIDAGAGFDVQRAIATVGERIRGVPRLRQRLVPTPPGCGRPVWVDAPAFRLEEHVDQLRCPGPADERAVLELAATRITERLPPDRPLWRMTFVTAIEGDRAALIVAFHHVLADGIGGLAVLASLVDGAAVGPVAAFPEQAPSTQELALDALRTRVTTLRRLPTGLRRVRAAFAQLRLGSPAAAQPCSIQQPTGPRRRFALVRVDLAVLRSVAHRDDATVNDVVLTAVAAALRSLCASRGESVSRFVISVPVSARRQASADDLGNEVGVIPIEIPAAGDRRDRLRAIAERTRAAKRTPPAASTAVLGPAFRVLARLGVFEWFIDRQHRVHTFVTNLRGPDTPLSFTGAPITDVIAVSVTTGNVSVAFAVLSYAGTLGITVIADPDACPDLDVLVDALESELAALTDRGDA